MDRSIDSGISEQRQPQADSNGFVNRRSVGSIPTTGSESENSDFVNEFPRAPRQAAGDRDFDDHRSILAPSGIPAVQDQSPWTTAEILAALDRLDLGGPGECWPARGSRVKDGYGRFFARGSDYQIHRVILEGKLGRRLTSEEKARHTCDNPPCGNPHHLLPGSVTDNNHDALRRDRLHFKLTPAQIEEIRAAAKSARHGDWARLARRFGVSPQYVGRIARGEQRTILPSPVEEGEVAR